MLPPLLLHPGSGGSVIFDKTLRGRRNPIALWVFEFEV